MLSHNTIPLLRIAPSHSVVCHLVREYRAHMYTHVLNVIHTIASSGGYLVFMTRKGGRFRHARLNTWFIVREKYTPTPPEPIASRHMSGASLRASSAGEVIPDTCR